jgi:hypothetical protein
VTAIVTKGYQAVLMPEDLWPIRPKLSAEYCFNQFMGLYKKDRAEGNASVARALRSHGRQFAKALVLQFGYTCCNFLSTLMLLWLIGSLSDISVEFWMPWMFGGQSSVALCALCLTHTQAFSSDLRSCLPFFGRTRCWRWWRRWWECATV